MIEIKQIDQMKMKLMNFVLELESIDDYVKDGSMELFTKTPCIL